MSIVVHAGRRRVWSSPTSSSHSDLLLVPPLISNTYTKVPSIISGAVVAGAVSKPLSSNTGPAGYGISYTQMTKASTTTIPGITRTTDSSGKNNYNITQSGTYDGIDFDGKVTISADNVVLHSPRIVGNGYGPYPITFNKVAGGSRPPTGFRMSYPEIDGNGTDATQFLAGVNSGSALSTWIAPGWSWVVDHANIYHFTDSGKPQDNPAGTSISLTYSYFHDPIYTWDGSANGGQGGLSHNDGFQIAGGGADSVTIQYNNYDLYRLFDAGSGLAPKYASGGSQFGSFNAGTTSPVTNLVVDSNWFNGFVDAIRMAFTGSQVSTVAGSRFTRNRIGLNISSGAKTASGTAVDGTKFLWGAAYQTGYDNVWDVGGTTDHGDVVTAGQVIP